MTTTVRDAVLSMPGLGHVEVASDRDMLRKLVEGIGSERPPAPRWAHVMARLGHGSGVSAGICRALDLDPDEIVGVTAEECEGCERDDVGTLSGCSECGARLCDDCHADEHDCARASDCDEPV